MARCKDSFPFLLSWLIHKLLVATTLSFIHSTESVIIVNVAKTRISLSFMSFNVVRIFTFKGAFMLFPQTDLIEIYTGISLWPFPAHTRLL
jgi:hypothetical protein